MTDNSTAETDYQTTLIPISVLLNTDIPFEETDPSRYSGIEGQIDKRNEKRVRAAHANQNRAKRDRRRAESELANIHHESQRLLSEKDDLGDAQFHARKHDLDCRATAAGSAHAQAKERLACTDSILRQTQRNPYLFGVMFEHQRIHTPELALENLIGFAKVAGPALQVAAIRLIKELYERLDAEGTSRGKNARVALTSYVANKWDVHPVTVRRLLDRAASITPGAETPYAGTIFDTARDMDLLAKKTATEQIAYAAHAKAHRTFFVIAGWVATEVGQRKRVVLREAELRVLDELGRNEPTTRAFLANMPLHAAVKWLADQLDAYRRQNPSASSEAA